MDSSEGPWVSLAVAAVGLGAVGVWVDLSPRVESDFFFSEDDPQLQVSLELDRRYPGRAQVVVRAEDGAEDPGAYRERIGELTEAFSEVEGVTDVRSITTDDAVSSPLFSRILLTPNVAATNLILSVDTPDPEVLLPRLEAVVERLSAARPGRGHVRSAGDRRADSTKSVS